MQPTTAQPTSTFWSDGAKYSDQGRANTIAQAYKTYMGRDPDSSGFDYWYGTPIATNQVDSVLKNSTEGKRGAVSKAYQDILGRQADEQGLQYWLNSGMSADDIIKHIQGSPESQSIYNPTPEQVTGELGKFDKNSQNPVDLYNQALEKLGISDARTRVANLRSQLMNTENLLKNVDSDVTGRTSNSLVTESQRRRLVASEQQPLTGQVDTLNSALGNAQADQGDILSQGQSETEYAVKGQELKRQALLDRLKTAIDKTSSEEDKRRWQSEYDRLLRQDELARAQDSRDYNYKVQQDALDRLKANASSSSGGGGSGGRKSSGSSASGGSSAPAANYQQRADKGFNFQSSGGKTISARLFAQETGTDFNNLLKQMAAAGDIGAADVLKNGGSSKYYKAMTWD